MELSGSLYEIREVLRERLPACAVHARQPAGLAVEQILSIDERSFWISGWMHDEDGEGVVTVVSPEGARVEVTKTAYRFERPDVVQFYSALRGNPTRNHGFTAFFELPAPSLLSDGWIAELRTSDGVAVEIRCPAVVSGSLAIRATILGELGNRGPVGGTLATEHGRHALTRLQERIVEDSEVDSIDVYGEPPSSPEVSIVIPLYKRLDFIEHQFLQFSPTRTSPRRSWSTSSTRSSRRTSWRRRCANFHPLRPALQGRQPHRRGRVRGGQPARDQGLDRTAAAAAELRRDPRPAGVADGDARVLRRAGGNRGAGPQALYEDDSLQHAGLYFHRAAGAELWENAHCFKGLHRDFPAANVARPVPAVTAACLLVDRERYEEVGGLPLHYVQGDYEDSELCLRMSQAGYENWYLPQVELYHLEGQSYGADTRRITSVQHVAPQRDLGRADRGADGGLQRQPGDRRSSGSQAVRITRSRSLRPATVCWGRTWTTPRRGWLRTPTRSTSRLGRSATAPGRGGRSLLGARRTPDRRQPRGAAARRRRRLPRRAAGRGLGGFRAVVGVLENRANFGMAVRARLADGSAAPASVASRAAAAARRRAAATTIQPLMVNTIGRSGSTWLAWLLTCHPEVVGYRPMEYDARVGTYWTSASAGAGRAAQLSQPDRPEPTRDRPHLVAGGSATGSPRLRTRRWKAGSAARRSRSSPALCQSADRRLLSSSSPSAKARRSRASSSRSSCPSQVVLDLLAEIFPGASELILVRDFRDMLSSVLAFNRKRG